MTPLDFAISVIAGIGLVLVVLMALEVALVVLFDRRARREASVRRPAYRRRVSP